MLSKNSPPPQTGEKQRKARWQMGGRYVTDKIQSIPEQCGFEPHGPLIRGLFQQIPLLSSIHGRGSVGCKGQLEALIDVTLGAHVPVGSGSCAGSWNQFLMEAMRQLCFGGVECDTWVFDRVWAWRPKSPHYSRANCGSNSRCQNPKMTGQHICRGN